MSTRTDLIAGLPWVTWLNAPQPCQGYRWSHMPGKALRDPAVMDRFRCRNSARWQFSALREGVLFPADDGVYCWPHLLVQMNRNPAEEKRTEEWISEQENKEP